MSEQRIMPEVLPGDLITRVGLYQARCGDIVPITGWEDGWWITEWDGVRSWYASNGHQRFYEGPDADRWQLLHWVGPLPATEPEPETTTEQLAEIEGQAEQPPQPQPIQVREGRWKTRAGEIVSVSAMPTDDDNFSPAYPWWDGDVATWANNGVFFSAHTADKDLVEHLGPIQQQPQPEPEPESDSELRIRLLKEANNNQAETIGQLKSEARDLNMEIGGLERQLLQRDARIRDLETMHAAAVQTVVDAGKQNDALRVQVRILQQEASKKDSRIEFLETLNAGNGAAIDDYRAQVQKLQGLVDFARKQLEDAANEISQQRSHLDACDKQLDQKDAQIRDLRIELDAAQQVPQPVSDEERERIWDEATEAAGRQVVRWLRPLTLAFNRHPDALFYRMMALTIQVLPDVLPELLGYAVEDESLDSDEDGE